ncbi:MAG: GMC oxidoreductase [Brasilonema sp.]
MPHEPYIQKFVERLQKQGLNPCSLPIGIDLKPGGRCIFCPTCENFPCYVLAKGDADACCVRPALESQSIEIMTQTYARRLLTNSSGRRVVGIEVERGGEIFEVSGDIFVVACGAINSAALFLRSANDKHPNGLANLSGLVGRNLMGHNVSFFLAFQLERANDSIFPKTWQINDFYFKAPDWHYPLGNIQANGGIPIHVLTPRVFQGFLKKNVDHRYISCAAISEDLPNPENRIMLTLNHTIQVNYKPNNIVTHQRLHDLVKRILLKAGYPVILSPNLAKNVSVKIPHQCGTMRFGNDPEQSVLDPFCRTHDIQNLYCVDGSFFPSSGALNPTLTIIAQALRVGEYLLTKHS